MLKNKNKSDFKIIAIQPIKGCKRELLKVLEEDTIYHFYNDYKINGNDIVIEETSPNSLYDEKSLKINISAIAGQNGSGKSTIIELLFMAINNIAYHYKIKEDLELIKGLKVALFFKTVDVFKLIINDNEITYFKYDKDGKLNIINKSKFPMRNLFYTIGINYSHYAYNTSEFDSNEQKDWLSALFHKNDAYQTPLVINPWRENGNIIINRENELVKSRLISNLLQPYANSTINFRQITNNLTAKRLVLKANNDKVLNGELYRKPIRPGGQNESIIKISLKDLDLNQEKILTKINKFYDFGYDQYLIRANAYEKLAMNYLIRKLISISIKYDEYNEYFSIYENDFNWKKIDDYIKLLIRDKSHIAFKFKQTLNYLKYQHIEINKKGLDLSILSKKIQLIIESKKSHKLKVIELIPPPIFSVDIILQSDNDSKKEIAFKTLSSGEKQMVYSVSSVLYHLLNLDSVSASTPTKIKYKYVNIVLEEIELYFHPELQRNYILLLRESIINLGLKDIRNINICFVTHSPFILSDIPNSNVMFLKLIDGKAIQVNQFEKTFGANIHDLLSDGFFLQDGVCGAFAIKTINKVINFLNKKIDINFLKKNLDPNNPDPIKIKRIRELSKELNEDEEGKEKDYYSRLIRTIGEPVVSTKLLEMYDEAFPEDHKVYIKAEILRLQKLLED